MMMDMTLNLPEDAYQPGLSRDQYAAKVVTDAIRRGWEPTGDDQRQGTSIAELVDRDEYERYWRDGVVFDEQESLYLWRAAASAVKHVGPTGATDDDDTSGDEEQAEGEALPS
jgi:hypothetical protein